MTPEIIKTNRRNPHGVKSFADQYRTFNGHHFVCLDCDLREETIADWRARLKAAGIAVRKVGSAIYVRHDQAETACRIVNH